MLSILKSNHPFIIAFIFVSSILMWINTLFHPMDIAVTNDLLKAPFYVFISNKIQINSISSVFIAWVIVILQGFLLVQFNKKYILINSRTYLPAFFYILISGSFIHLQRINPVLIGTLFVFISINYIFSTYREDYALNKLFLAGFFIAIASLFWAPFAVMFLIVIISLTILRPLVGREWIVSILGFLAPYLFVLTYYYVFTDIEQQSIVISNFKDSFYLLKEFVPVHFSYYIFSGVLLLIVILASYTIIKNYQKKKIKTRKFFEINWWIFLIGVLLFAFFKNVSYEIIYLLAFPISFLLTDYVYTVKKSWYLSSILFILIGSIVLIQIFAI